MRHSKCYNQFITKKNIGEASKIIFLGRGISKDSEKALLRATGHATQQFIKRCKAIPYGIIKASCIEKVDEYYFAVVSQATSKAYCKTAERIVKRKITYLGNDISLKLKLNKFIKITKLENNLSESKCLTETNSSCFKKAILELEQYNENFALSYFKRACTVKHNVSCLLYDMNNPENMNDIVEIKTEYYEKGCAESNPRSCKLLAKLLLAKVVVNDKDCNDLNNISCGILYDILKLKIPKMKRAVFHLLNKSCNLNDGEACATLGKLKQLVNNKEKKQIYDLFKKSCGLHDSQGCYHLGFIEKNNDNKKSMKKYFDKSCTYGNPWACVQVGTFKKDEGRYLEALSYYKKSKQMGHLNSKKEIADLEIKLGYKKSLFEKELHGIINKLFISCNNFVFYIQSFVVPTNSMLIYPQYQIRGVRPVLNLILTLGFFIFASIYILKKYSFRKELFFGILFFVVGFIPVSGIVYVPYMKFSYVADHWNYLGSMGLCILIIFFYHKLNECFALKYKRYTKPIVNLLMAMLVMLFVYNAYTYSRIFNNKTKLLKHNVAQNMISISPYIVLSRQYFKEKKYNKAKEVLLSALKVARGDTFADKIAIYQTLRKTYQRLDDYKNANEVLYLLAKQQYQNKNIHYSFNNFLKYKKLFPLDKKTNFFLSLLYFESGKLKKAKGELDLLFSK